MAIETKAAGQPEDLQDQIARLRTELDTLLKDKVSPAMAAVAGRAEEAAQTARRQADVLAGYIREWPSTAVLIAAAVGWAICRATR
jgi:ElaB/YqjD/DUF883 family membrane-anchored ribosome-binding protein